MVNCARLVCGLIYDQLVSSYKILVLNMVNTTSGFTYIRLFRKLNLFPNKRSRKTSSSLLQNVIKS